METQPASECRSVAWSSIGQARCIAAEPAARRPASTRRSGHLTWPTCEPRLAVTAVGGRPSKQARGGGCGGRRSPGRAVAQRNAAFPTGCVRNAESPEPCRAQLDGGRKATQNGANARGAHRPFTRLPSKATLPRRPVPAPLRKGAHAQPVSRGAKRVFSKGAFSKGARECLRGAKCVYCIPSAAQTLTAPW